MRVYYVSGYANEVYYVHAENEEAAEALLRKQIGKHIFKTNLQDDEVDHVIDKLGDNIIVEFGISKGTLKSDKLRFDDMTAAAYIFAQNGMKPWTDWEISTADIIGDKNVAESLEKTIFGVEKAQEEDV